MGIAHTGFDGRVRRGSARSERLGQMQTGLLNKLVFLLWDSNHSRFT